VREDGRVRFHKEAPSRPVGPVRQAGVTPVTVAALLGELGPEEADALVELGDDWLDRQLPGWRDEDIRPTTSAEMP
jgi:hypothetical protein